MMGTLDIITKIRRSMTNQEIQTKVTEIQKAISSLPSKDRAKIASFILEGLEEAHYWVEDEEVLRRAAEFESGDDL